MKSDSEQADYHDAGCFHPLWAAIGNGFVNDITNSLNLFYNITIKYVRLVE